MLCADLFPGRFGVGVKSYFVFLRYLIYLNLLHCALIWGFILGPTTFYGRRNGSGESAVMTDYSKFTTTGYRLLKINHCLYLYFTEPLRFGGNDSVLDFLLGSGYLDRSPVFYGFYTRGSLNLPCLNTPLLYFAGILTILFLSLIMVVRRTTVGYKHTWMLGKRYSMNVSYKIFCGWDFTIQDPSSATLKSSFIRNELKLLLEEQNFSLREAQRTLGQRVRLYLLRFILNVLIVSLLGGAFYLIYTATVRSQNDNGNRDYHLLVRLFLQYLPPITITFVNLVLPHMFRKISSFEDYSFHHTGQCHACEEHLLEAGLTGDLLIFPFHKNNTSGMQGEPVWQRDVQAVHFQLPCHFLQRLSFELPEEVGAGEEPYILAGPVAGETALPDTVQRVGSGVQSDSILGGDLLLPSAASDRNCHTGAHVLHQKVHSPAVLCCRAANVSSLQFFSFIPLHVAAWSLHGCNHSGRQHLPSQNGQYVTLWSICKWRNSI
uniref:Transmembrane channel-like 8 n=1 Tax=Lates calcarifer TaxID=8187 RepID=A0A4W6CAE3_LATCA